jgi:hypothetical protein
MTIKKMVANSNNDVRFACFMCRAVFDSRDDFARYAKLTTHDYFVATKED